MNNILAKGRSKYGKSVAEVLETLKKEVQDLETALASAEALSDEEYLSLLQGNPSSNLRTSILQAAPLLAGMIRAGTLEETAALDVARAAAVITVAPTRLLAPGLDTAKQQIESLAAEYCFDLPPEGSDEWDEYAVLQAMFSQSQNIATNFFRSWKPFKMMKNWNSPLFNDGTYIPPPGYTRPAGDTTPEMKPHIWPFTTKTEPGSHSTVVPTFNDEQIIKATAKQI
eukprot:GABV01001210.1.p1 GENE.GABV01001210.1~~GABV01001210.1.p1  ORF type:complete len:235 (+),score=80.56 GABV01001210.1:26-706(+)